MLAYSVVAQFKNVGHFESEVLATAAWAGLSIAEKLQIIAEAPSSHFLESATSDQSELVRYWAIRHAGYQRHPSASYEQMQRLRQDPSRLVAARATVWSYDDIPGGDLSAVEAFVSGASWKETRQLRKLLESLVAHEPIDWKRVNCVLRAFLAAPDVEHELRGRGPHNSFVVDEAVKALEYLKAFMLKYHDQTGNLLPIGLPLGFHHFELLEGWENFPPRVVELIAWGHKGPEFQRRVLDVLHDAKLSDSRLIAIREHLKSADESYEWSENRWGMAPQ